VRKTIANKGSRPVMLTGRTAARVARAVNAYERGDRNIPGRKFDRGGLSYWDSLRLGKTTAAWEKGDTATITLWEDGTPPDEVATTKTIESVVNHLHYVASGVFVLLGMGETGSWYLVASEMPPILTGEFVAPWAKGSTKSITVDFTPPGAAAAVSFSVTARNHYVAFTGADTRKCAVSYDGEEFVLIAAEC
jgi:hypothetical protein